MPMGESDDMSSTMFEGIFEKKPQLFPPQFLKKEDVRELTHCFRLFRRTSDTRVIEINVSNKGIEAVNRWRLVEKRKGKKFSQPMKQYCAQYELLLEAFLRYTKAM